MVADANIQALLTIRDLATRAITSFEQRAGQAAKRTEDAFRRTDRAADGLRRTFRSLAVAAAAFFGARQAIRAIGDFESGLIAVRKTTDLAGEELRQLGDDIIRLGQVTPRPIVELLSIAEAAGRVGVRGRDNIVAFVEAIARLGVSTDLAGEEAVIALSRILTASREPQSEVGRLGSVIARLGDNIQGSERPIAEMALELAKATAQFGLTSTELTGLSAALVDMGQRANASRTAFQDTFNTLDQAARRGGAAMAELTRITGQSQEEFARLFAADRVGALLAFVDGLARISKQGENVVVSLERLGLADDRLSAIIQTLVSRNDRLRSILALAADEQERNTKLTTESGLAFESLNSSIQRVSNALVTAAEKAGDAGLLGVLKGLLQSVGDGILILSGMSDSLERVTLGAKLATGAIVAFIAAVSIAALRAIVGQFAALALLLPKLAAGIRTLTRSVRELDAATKSTIAGFIASLAITAALSLGFNAISASAQDAGQTIEEVGEKAEELSDKLTLLRDLREIDVGVAILGPIGDDLAVFERAEQLVSGLRARFEDLRSSGGTLTLVELTESLRVVNSLARELSRQLETGLKGATEEGRASILTLLTEVNKLRDALIAAKDSTEGVTPALSEAGQAVKDITSQLSEENRFLLLAGDAADRYGRFKKAIIAFLSLEQAERESLGPALEREIALNERLNAALDLRTALAKLSTELEGRGAADRERAFRRQVDQIAELARIAGFSATQIEAGRAALQRLFDESKRDIAIRSATESLQDFIRSVKEETDAARIRHRLRGEDAERIEFEIELQRRLNEARRAGVDITELERQAREAFEERPIQAGFDGDEEDPVRFLDETLKRATRTRQVIADVAAGAKLAFEEGFFQVMQRGFTDLEGAVKDFARIFIAEIQRIIAAQLAARLVGTLTGAILGDDGGGGETGGGASTEAQGISFQEAQGALIDRGRIIPFQRGGVIGRRTLFPLADGRRALAGESGPEGILPLARTPSGDLGVQVAGRQSGAVSINYAPTIVVEGGGGREDVVPEIERLLRQDRERFEKTMTERLLTSSALRRTVKRTARRA